MRVRSGPGKGQEQRSEGRSEEAHTDFLFPKCWQGNVAGEETAIGFLLCKYLPRAYFVINLNKPHAPPPSPHSYLILTSALLSEQYFKPIL